MVRGFVNVNIDGDIEKVSSERLMKKMTSSWESISEVKDIAFKYVKRGEELDTAGLARAVNLGFVKSVRTIR